ncbi:MAG TPA: rubrerythrin [Gammaproteobacteria bacterium]|nr:rubrerythrin [Gammaproteobacteria bacterium]
MNTIDEILDYAIDQEQQAADFYEEVAKNAETASMKKILLDFSEEEKHHKKILQAVKTGEHELTPQQEILDLKIADYLVEVEVSKNISYQDALIIAMKRERAAYELYTDIAARVPEGHLREVLDGLAREEEKHKLFFETEYDERILTDN